MNSLLGTAKTVNELLKDVKYSIDYYQREYKWQDKQITELMDDLTGKFCEAYDSSHVRSKVESYPHYFMGSIIISEKNTEKYIVDGQQRLTSLTLLLILLRNLQKNNQEKVSVEDLIFSEKYGKKSFNLDVKERNKCMQTLYDGEFIDTNGEEESIRNMYLAYQCLENSFPEELKGNALPYFIDWLKYNVHLVEITAYSDDDAYSIFETMNDRGLSLRPTDMLKGYLLANINETRRLEVNMKWRKRIQEFNEKGKEIDSEFFKAWFRSQYAIKIREVAKGSVNEDFDIIGTGFHRWLRSAAGKIGLKNEDDFAKFVDTDFDFYSKQYLKLMEASRKPVVGLEHIFYNTQQNFGLQYMVLLAPLSPYDNEDIIKLKFSLVSHYIDILLTWKIWNSRTIASGAMKNSMFNISKEIRGLAPIPLAQKLNNSLLKITETFENNKWFVLNHQNRDATHRLLARLTEYVEVQAGQPSHYFEYMSKEEKNHWEVEHIWANHYEQHKDELDQSADFSDYRNHIGDLLLLPKSFNASYGDLPFEEKVTRYYSQNLLASSLNLQAYTYNPGFLRFINESQLPFKAYSQFKKVSIDERGELYRQLAERVWNPEDILRKVSLPIVIKEKIDNGKNFNENENDLSIEATPILEEELGAGLALDAEIIQNNQDLVETKKIYKEQTATEETNTYIPTEYTGEKPTFFTINNKKILVNSWKDILVGICNFLYENHSKDFEQKVAQVKGKERVYFSRNSNELRTWEQIKNSGIYVETCFNANQIVRLGEKLATLFGYSKELHIETK
jgi:uncharacterized protein with ParB-like and HNH nuclease domain